MSELIDAVKELLPISTVGIALAGFTYAFAKYLNETVNEDIRMRVSLWFLGDAPKFAWQSHVLAFFDSFFGQKALSWKRLRRVAVVTLTVSVLEALYVVSVLKASGHPPDVVGFVAPALLSMFTFPIDYMAVLKTGLLFHATSRLGQSVYTIPLLLAVDIGLTFILVALAMVAVFVGFMVINNSSILLLEFAKARPLTQWQSFSLEGVTRYRFFAQPSAAVAGIHTIWLFIYFLATLLAKGATRLSARLPLMAKMLSQERIEKSPITLIGEFGAVIVLLIFLAGGLIMPGNHSAAKNAETATARPEVSVTSIPPVS